MIAAPTPIERMPTDMIPNTADSSPLISRDHSKYSLRSEPKIEELEEDEVEVQVMEEEEEEKEQRLKVVSLFYRPHEGVPAQEPYSIKNKQLVNIFNSLSFMNDQWWDIIFTSFNLSFYSIFSF